MQDARGPNWKPLDGEKEEAYVRRYYDRDWADRRLYHMMINSCMGCDAMIDSVLDGAGKAGLRQPVTTGSGA